MRKLSVAIASSAFVALLSATPAFAFTSSDQSVGQGVASNFSDPDAQFDRLAGSGDDAGSSGIVQFGGSAMDASAARAGLAVQQDKDSSYSGFYIPPDK